VAGAAAAAGSLTASAAAGAAPGGGRPGRRVGYLYHEIYAWHDTGTHVGLFPSDPGAGLQPYAHFEHPDTKRRMHELLVVAGLTGRLTRIDPRPAAEEDLLRVHTRDYVERIKAASELPAGGDAGDGSTRFGKGGYEIAALS